MDGWHTVRQAEGFAVTGQQGLSLLVTAPSIRDLSGDRMPLEQGTPSLFHDNLKVQQHIQLGCNEPLFTIHL